MSTPSGGRIIKKVALKRLPAWQRCKRTQTRGKRYETQRPGHGTAGRREVHRALRYTGRKKSYYQDTAIDDCARVRGLRLRA